MARLAAWWRVRNLLGAAILAASIPCAATPACTQIEVQGHVQAAKGALTLADLLVRGSCAELGQAAAQVSLGSVPRRGGWRVIDGGEVRRLLAELVQDNIGAEEAAAAKIPERIVIEPAGAMKGCAEIASFISAAGSRAESGGIKRPSDHWQGLNCAAAQRIPEDARLELTKTSWQAANSRWEFMLRCARAEDCVPFLVWADGENVPNAKKTLAAESLEVLVPWIVKRGQTASLIWDERGIRIVAPVTCLEGGGVGESVRVRFQNGPGILRAKISSDGTLRASL